MNSSELKELQEEIAHWKNKPERFEEKSALSKIELLDETLEEEKQTAADLYGLLAEQRWKKVKRFDPLIKNWMNQALQFNEAEDRATSLKSIEQIKQLQARVFTLPVPSMRETDQSSARKKAAGQLKNIADNEIEELQTAVSLVHSSRLINRIDSAEELSAFLKEGLDLYNHLRESADQYLQTASGSFYSPEQVKEIKQTSAEIEKLKREWQTWLSEQEEATSSADPLTELNEMIGLEKVKNRVERMYHYLQYQKLRKEKGYQWNDERSLHMILTGNPGTGKTMLARLLAKIYHQLGLLPRDEVLETDRSHLVGGYVGQTEEKTMNVIKESVGGILFIDEAYSLRREGMAGNDFGQTAVDTLVAAMTGGEYAGSFAVIMAGYPEEMRQFLQSNPGLRSRFPESNHIHLPDYSARELLSIGDKMAMDNDYIITADGKKKLQQRIEKEQVDDTFGNARTVKNIIMDAIFLKGSMVGDAPHSEENDFSLLTKEDMQDPDEYESTTDIRSPESQLDALVGLEDVKREIKKLASFASIQKRRRDHGAEAVPIHLHTVFSGPPGTGKTTVARLYASILKNLGFLKRGHLIVAGRSDLVAEYTGQTAMKTRRKIREALGGMLFIDEAYSLTSSSRNDFGKEAMDTIVEEMTKYDDNLVIVLSGYSEPMAELFALNTGLRSRFKKQLYFPSYSAEQLASITIAAIRQFGYNVDNSLLAEFSSAYDQMDTSGNARFAMDVAEEVFQQQAWRLANADFEKSDLNNIIREDISKALENKQS
ncbi:AAA family ATPase [Alteribacillus sp. HJP-4]|uniref:AAA family ATPase n=1 Tax=Alteribacillus sp. HJP-4 TaxID=2775394 RepID=UPI0035CD1B3C